MKHSFTRNSVVILVWCLCGTFQIGFSFGFGFLPIATTSATTRTPCRSSSCRYSLSHLAAKKETMDDDDDKFSFAQRIESVKCVVVGALAGGVALTPVAALHDIAFDYGGSAQWEFDTDMGSIEAALFAIVYRYCIREDDNPMLNQGVIGAFVLCRTLSRIQVPTYCTSVPLNCGAPTGYFDWDMIGQAALSGAESVALFGAAAAAMDYCFSRKIISKFP